MKIVLESFFIKIDFNFNKKKMSEHLSLVAYLVIMAHIALIILAILCIWFCKPSFTDSVEESRNRSNTIDIIEDETNLDFRLNV